MSVVEEHISVDKFEQVIDLDGTSAEKVLGCHWVAELAVTKSASASAAARSAT